MSSLDSQRSLAGYLNGHVELNKTQRRRWNEKQRERISKERWIVMYGGQELLDAEGFQVVPCGANCDDSICHGWRVVPK